MEENNIDNINKETKEVKDNSKIKNPVIFVVSALLIIIIVVIGLFLINNDKKDDTIQNTDNNIISNESNQDNVEDETGDNQSEGLDDTKIQLYTVKDEAGNEYLVKYKFDENGNIIDFEGNIVEDTSGFLDEEGNLMVNNDIITKDNIYKKITLEDLGINIDELEVFVDTDGIYKENESKMYVLPDDRILVYNSDDDFHIIDKEDSRGPVSSNDPTFAVDETTKESNKIPVTENTVTSPVVFENDEIKVVLEGFNRGIDTEYEVKNKQNTGNIIFRVYSKENKNDFTINLLNLMVNNQRLNYNVYVESNVPDSTIVQSWFMSPDSTEAEEITNVTCEILINFWNPDSISTTATMNLTNFINSLQ